MNVKAFVRRVPPGREPAREGEGERGPFPEVVFLFAQPGPEARAAFEMLPKEAGAWRRLAEMEAARARVRSTEGRVWDAAVCVGPVRAPGRARIAGM